MSGVRPALRRPGRLPGAVAAASVLAILYAGVLADLVVVWARIPYYSYGFLVPLFSAWLAWDSRGALAGARPAWSWPGLALAGGGLALLVVGQAGGSLTLRALSLPAVLAGTCLLALGRRGLAVLAFPVGFLVFMAPLPEGAIRALSSPLQHLAAWFAAGALPLAGIPATREGLVVRIPHVLLEVTEACSGLRFLLAMLVLGTAFAWTTQRALGRRLAVVAAAAALAIGANLLRVAGTGWIAHHYGAEAASGLLHVAFGKVVYLAVLGPFVAGVARLRRSRGREADI